MPTYTVFSPSGQLSAEQRQAIAREVTAVHNAVTGANSFFAQVVFQDVEPGQWFMGGKPLEGRQIYLCGHIRGGRPAEVKGRLLIGMRDALVRCAGASPGEVWVYIVELPPSLMVEYGRVLPEPGQEQQWLEEMPAEDRARLEKIGS